MYVENCGFLKVAPKSVQLGNISLAKMKYLGT